MFSKRKGIIILIVAVLAISLLVISRKWISRHVYVQAGHRLTERLSPEQQAKYGEELRYTLEKFWSFYEKGLISQNDLTDVMDKMKRLEKKDEITDDDIFNFGGYVSRIYSDAMHEYHKKTLNQ